MKTTLSLITAFYFISAAAVGQAGPEPERKASRQLNSFEEIISSEASQKKSQLTTCTDKINYVGNVAQYYVSMGNSPSYVTGIYQTYALYEGSVLGVEFDAAKSATVNGDAIVYVRIFERNVSPVLTSPLSQAVAVTITNVAVTTYSVLLPIPVTISNNDGFAVGIVNSSTSSRPIIPFSPPTGLNFVNAWISDMSGGDYAHNITSYYNTQPVNALIRPIVSTTVNPAWVVEKNSTGCELPVQYSFYNNSQIPSPYTTYSLICPGGQSATFDPGDGSPPDTQFSGATHSYSVPGTYTASFKQTYHGWTNTCSETLTTSVIVESPQASFTYSVNGLTVIFNNTSSGFSAYDWNFGDLSTATDEHPIYTYDSPGAYVVELKGTAPCGEVVYYVTIQLEGVGIGENSGERKKLRLYPNPVTDVLTVELASGVGTAPAVALYNSTGQLLKTPHISALKNGKLEMEVAGLPPGCYFIRVAGENKGQGVFLKR